MKIPNEKCRKFIRTLPGSNGTPFGDAFNRMSPEAQGLLSETLRWDPESRTSVFDLIRHPYLGDLHCPEDEPTRTPLDTSDFEFERRKITAAALREEIFREALMYYPELLSQFMQDLEAGHSSYNISEYRLLAPGESQYSSDEEGEDSS